MLPAALAGSMAGVLFLLPSLAAGAPFLALPLAIAGLFAALPLLVIRISGRLIHGVLATVVATLLILSLDSVEAASGFVVLFGVWALVSGEVLSRSKSVIAASVAGLVILSVEALLAASIEGAAPIEATLHTPQVQASFDQWAAQVPLEPAEAKATIERVRAGIMALYPSLSVISAATIVALNAVALGRVAPRIAGANFPRGELLTLRWPLTLVVAFVGSGALLLLPQAQTVAWNGLVVTLFLFLLQGLSVLAVAVTRLFQGEVMRTLFVIASLLGPWAILLSLIGLFDQWFDFRSRFTAADTPAAP